MLVDVSLRPAPPDAVLLKRAVLHTLTYADVFDYPLTLSEVHRYLSFQQATVEEVARALDDLVESCAVIRAGECFTLPGRESIAGTRQRRRGIAASLWRKALRYGRIMASLPFVRMVAVTGSLAMNNTEQGKDIDFMLVSTPGRLWTARALAILLTHLARLEGVSLCPNYIVTTRALEFHDHSLYVAHEMAQMVPLSGVQLYSSIRDLNAWTDEFLPNAGRAIQPRRAANQPARWQRLMEAVLDVLPTQWFEAWEMKRKIRKLSRQQSSSPEAYFSADVCKGHADRHGLRTEMLLRQRLERLGSL